MTKIERIFELLANVFTAILLIAFGVCLICGMVQLYSYCTPLFWIALAILIPTIVLVGLGIYSYDYQYSEKWWKEINEQREKQYGKITS